MERFKEGQIPFGELGMELVIDLDNREKSLRPKKAQKAVAGQAPKVPPTRQWWERMGLRTFRDAAEGWKVSQGARADETFGRDAAFGSGEMTRAETEERLKKALRVAQRSGIRTLAVVGMMRDESFRLEQRLGSETSWLPTFVDSAIDVLAEVYRLRLGNREALKRFAHQRDLR